MASDTSPRESSAGSPGSTVAMGQPPEPGEVLHIKCGQVVAKLHMDRFICPGIHQECIEVEDGVFVTPKTFAVMGEKEKLKDWKNAIRLNGRSIRKLMEIGDLEFSRHNEICTGRCASRNIGTSKYDLKIEQLKNNQELDMSPASATPTPPLSKHKSRRKKRIPQSLSQSSGDLASLRTLLSGPLLNEPGFTALREAQGEEVSPSATCFRNQPVFPSAVMVPANQAIKVEPTSHIDDDDSNSLKGYDDDAKPPVSFINRLIERHSFGSKNGNIHKSDYLRRDMPFLMNGGSLISANNHHNDSDPESLVGSVAFTPGEHPAVSMNKDVLEAIKFASDLPDTDSLLDGEMSADSVTFWQNILDLGLMDSFFKEIKRELDCLKHDFVAQHRANQKNAQQLSNIVSELGLMTKLKWRLAQAKSQTEREKEDLSNHIELLKKHVAESEQKQRELKRKSECFETLIDLGRAKRRASSTPNSVLSSTSPPPPPPPPPAPQPIHPPPAPQEEEDEDPA
ncbi:hypothetical protein CAPTEDRAFT_228077 [Capitella teleta]|uniref:SAND domain-containing protein n=1 Tax=Capitella teleta TaxID=283909 RepID=R7US74_CAPTE|nr:hypothetical protein CAPTEDRAFT_228077 [Capitella teleta]|eukprot:ELU08988.1 hypothetical protein CAPTEDRAFT_228077 [Capitella teleta]